jgi:uncharacterized lipoprotein YmbA
MFSRLLLVAAVALVMCGTTHVRAEELALPGQAELSTFSPQAIRFYGLGYRALDRVDYVNAYAYLSKKGVFGWGRRKVLADGGE